MQISASTILAQQAPRVAPKAAQPADAFEPLSFKQTAKALPEMQAAAPAKSGTSASPVLSNGPSAAYVRPGTNIDIKV